MKTRGELMAWLKDAEATINKYGWENRETHPYIFSMPAWKIIRDCKEYDKCTEGSKEYLLLLATGFKDVLDSWVKYQKAPKVKVRNIKTGKIFEICENDVDIFLEPGITELV